ncbi:MAG: DUF697 domain-containing protein [Patescibacteria group bacterium]
MEKKFTKAFWIATGIGAFIFLVLILLSSVLSLGERLRATSPWLEVGFYVLAALLFILLIVRPVAIVLSAPTFSMESLFDEEENAKANYRMYRRVTKNVIGEDYLNDAQKKELEEAINDPIKLKKTLSFVFDETIKKELNKIIVKHAETVFLSTAISQNGRLDLAAVVVINLRLIKELVVKCGFRPSYAALGRLSFNVLTASVVAESLEGLDLNQLFPTQTLNALNEVPFLRLIAGSLAQGVGNALLSLRVGVICRNYLFMNLKGVPKSEMRKNAFGEALLLFPQVIATSVKKLPGRLRTIFEKVL